MTWDELKNLDFNSLDFKEIGNWPTILKALFLTLIFIALLFAAYWFDWSDQINNLNAAKAKEVKLRQTFLEKKKLAVNLPVYQQQLKDIQKAFGALLRQLPNKSEMESLITEINQAGLGQGLSFELFKPGNETRFDFYAVLPIYIRVTGSYHDFGAFASDVAQLPRIVTLNNIRIAPVRKNQKLLTMNVTAQTYRYLDENELAARQRAAKAKRKR